MTPAHRLTFPRSPVVAWALWAAAAIGIAIALAGSPRDRRTDGVYLKAALAFVKSEPLYKQGQHGYLYPPQSAIIYLPFSFQPRLASETLWRWAGLGLLATGVWRLSVPVSRARWKWDGDAFLLATLLVLPVALGSLRNGQMNLHIGAVFAHGCAAIQGRRWREGAAWLSLSLACKPTSIVVVLLFGALYPGLWIPLAAGLLLVAALPYANPHWGYVTEQYRTGIAKVLEAGQPGAGNFSDLTNVLRQVGVEIPFAAMSAIRAAAALATLGIGWLARRRFDSSFAALFVLAIGAAYLMIFNPRTEGNTYIIMGIPAAVMAAWALRREVSVPAVLLASYCLLLGCVHLAMPRGKDRVVRPTTTLLFLMATGGWVLARKRGEGGSSVRVLADVQDRAPLDDVQAQPPRLGQDLR
jgi:alpha-1,2-mannosyltransferase